MHGTRKVAIIGPESTGKSVLSEDLARSLETVWVPEYARQYLEGLGRNYNEADLLTIARGQLALEDELARKANSVLVCDTDLHVIKVWSEHKYGACNKEILDHIAVRKYDLYLLTGIDMPWAFDPLREHADQALRQYFYDIYWKICVESGVPFVAISGNRERRLAMALSAVRLFL